MRRLFSLILAIPIVTAASLASGQGGMSEIPGYRLIATNRCGGIISMAYRVRDYTGQWVTRGWFNINPGQTRTLYMPTTNTTFYYYGRRNDGSTTWSGQGKPGAIYRWVRRRAFLHSSGVLTGERARRVWFRRRVVPSSGAYRLNMTC
jgi:hypothetical protein